MNLFLFKNIHAIDFPSAQSVYLFNCDNKNDPNHLMPLAFYEFDFEATHENFSKLNRNLAFDLQKVSPLKFKNLNADLLTITSKFTTYHPPYDENVDSILAYPKGCSPVAIASLNLDSKKDIYYVSLNEDFWKSTNPLVQKYVLFELIFFRYLTKKEKELPFAPVDYRRFAYYFALDIYQDFNIQEKINFLKYYGVNEFFYQNLLLDLNREMVFFKNNPNAIRDAHPTSNATFEGANLNVNKFVSFYENAQIKAISTVSEIPIKVQDEIFYFWTDPESCTLSDRSIEGDKSCARMRFYPDGSLSEANINILKLREKSDRIHNSVSNVDMPGRGLGIKTIVYSEVKFYPSGEIYYYGGPNADINIWGKTMRAQQVYWNNKGNVVRASLERPVRIQNERGKIVDARYVEFKDDGSIKTALP